MLPPLAAETPASRICRISALGTGSGFSRRIDRVVCMISKMPGSSELASVITFSPPRICGIVQRPSLTLQARGWGV
jgi:hypothetical protein